MTTGETEETCGGQNEAGTTGEGNMKLPRSFTTLSTIAIQAGQALIVVSVLKSGSLVHLQLVQVHPGLCEIGSNQEETRTLIQDQKQLMEKLQKHEMEVLSAVEKNQQSELRRRRRMRRWDEGAMEQKRNSEEEEVHSAMAASLSEGWSLLLRLLQRRQEVLTLAADFYRRALEFAVGIDRVEDLRVGADDRLTEVQLTYDSMRKDLLGKSLQVLTSSSVLLQKLTQLQRTEALQRRGGVLQDEEDEEEEESPQSSRCSRGTALRLEQLVEALQDRRRRADQAVRLLLQQAENDQKEEPESREDWSLLEIPDQDLQILDQDLQLGPDVEPESAAAESTDMESRDLHSGSRSGLQPGPDVKPGSRPEETRDLPLGSRSDQTPGSRSDLKSGPDVKPRSRSDLKSDSKSEETRNLQPESRLDLLSGSRSGLQPGSRSEPTRDLKPGSPPEETRDLQLGSRSDQEPGSRSDLKPEPKVDVKLESDAKSASRSDETRISESGSRLELKPGPIPEATRTLTGSRSRSGQHPGPDLKPGSRTEETRDFQLGSRSAQIPGSRSGLKPEPKVDMKLESGSEPTRDEDSGSRSDETRISASGSRLELKSGPIPEATRNLLSGFKLNRVAGSRPDLKSDSRSEEIRDLQPEPTSDQTPGSRSEPKPEPKLDVRPESRSEETRELQSGFKPEVQKGRGSDLKPASRSEPTKDLDPRLGPEESRSLQSGSEPTKDLDPRLGPEESRSLQSGSVPTKDLDPRLGPEESRSMQSRSVPTKDLDPRLGPEESRSLQSGSEPTKDLDPRLGPEESRSMQSRSVPTKDLDPRLGPEESRSLRSGSEPTKDLDPRLGPEESRSLRSGSEPTKDLDPRLGPEESRSLQSGSEPTKDLDPRLGPEESRSLRSGSSGQVGVGHAHQVLLTNQRLQLLSSCEQLMDKICSWVQQSSSVLSNISEAGRQLLEAEDTLNTHLQLHLQAESAGRDAENLKQILDQIRALHSSRTGPQAPGEPGTRLSPLKALTQQLKGGSTGGRTRTGDLSLDPSAGDPTGSLSPELIGRVDVVLKELQSLNRKIVSNLQLLQPYVTFLRTAQQVEEEMEELREIYRRRLEEEDKEEVGAGTSRSPVKKKEQVVASWQETLQRLLTCQELGDNYVHTVKMVSGAALNLQSVLSVVQQTAERLGRTKQEVNELCSQQQIQMQQQLEYWRKYQERLHKTMQDLNSVSEMLDSCTLMDLGSDLQTSKLLERFSQARPHFTRLDAEVEFMVKNWETLRGVQDRLEVKELKGGAMKEEHLSELLKLQERVKNKIHHSESILDLTNSFHLTSKQLEALLQSDPISGSTGSCGSSEAEQQQQIQSLLKSASTLKTDICNAVNRTGRTCFRVEQLEARLLTLDSLCVSRLNEAARREEKLRRELLTRQLNDDINQLRDTFKELKKRFSNLRFNYLKRNDRTRNTKAVKNQLQQVEVYEEKLQALRKRLQGVTARLGLEVKDGGVARETEDAINELQRQMGEFERSVGEHQRTLEMTCRLQQAMEEYQFWCEDASATIARVGKFSSECRSTEAVSVLHRQFEKFVWPTVPQQEERISQITELAVRLHGAEEGRRYIEKTVSKHSEMVESIRELSDGLMELEAKLKLENLKQKQNDGDKVVQEGKETEEKEKKLKGNRKMKKEKTDNRSTQEASDMYELKETGHTPELTTEHDGKEVPVKRQTAANRKPPLQKSRSPESDRQQLYSSIHTFSLSCSPVEANRRVHAIHSLLQPTATEPQATPTPSVIGPSFSDIQRAFQRKEMQAVSASSGSNMTPLQDASAGGLSETELQQQEVMTEDSLSNDEYDCASPDDISLPPLAETPESNMAQSDIEEGYCFSSHSVHINQSSHQSDRSGTGTGTGTGTGAVRQQRESSRTESCPTPPTGLHNSTRFRSESSSFVQSPLTAPPPRLFTSTLCSILKTGKTSTVNIPQSADHSQGGPEPSSQTGHYSGHRSNTPDKDNDIPEKRSPSQTEPLLKEHNSQYTQPQRSSGTHSKITQNVASKGEILPQTDPVPQVAEVNHSTTLPQSSYCPQPFSGPGPDLHKEKTPPQDTRFLKCRPTYSQTRTSTCQDSRFPQSFPYFKSDLNQDMNTPEPGKETCPVSNPQRDSLTNTNTTTSTITQQTINFQSSDSHHSSLNLPQESPLSQSESMPQIGPVPQARGFAESPNFKNPVLQKHRTQETGLLTSCATCAETTATLPQEGKLSQSYLDSRSGLEQDVPSSQTSEETSVSMPQSSSLTTAITVKQTVYCQSSPPDRHCIVPQASRNPMPQQHSPFSQGSGGLPEVHASILPEPNSIDNISISSSTITNSNRVSSKQSHQTVYSLHESLTSTCTQQCVHDPGMTPSSTAKPAAPPQPEPQTQALAQQANPHVTPLSSPPHLLTPDQDPSICQPIAIREEIKLTPQIQGPPLPAPLPQAQAESLPQGKASKPGPPCFTRPLSRATVMEGSPVTLEVEVTGHPDPTLTWCKDGALSCDDGKHFLFIPEASVSDGWLREARAAERHPSGGGDKWLVAEVFDIVSVDWQTWFGTLCVLLWLLYLILL